MPFRASKAFIEIDGRIIPEWIGQTREASAPPRVQLRLFLAAGGRCAHCTRKLQRRRDWQLDHRLALINGGENRESNLQILCVGCHQTKTADDLAHKARLAKRQMWYLGIKGKKRLIPGSKGSGWRRQINGLVMRVPELK